MGLENLALTETSDLPIRHEGEVHSGKVRSVYWLNKDDSTRLIADKKYNVPAKTRLAAMVTSDRISAFECIWEGEKGLKGIPGKGAALNAISKYWFDRFDENGLAPHHIVDVPHPLVWIVQRAEPIMIEAIARDYISGSMWRAYQKGGRVFGEETMPNGLKNGSKLPKLLVTPSTKGIMSGIPGIPERDDVNITRKQIVDNYQKFGFHSVEDVDRYEKLLRDAFAIVSEEAAEVDEIFADTKFEMGYLLDRHGYTVMGYIDEAATPDSSRYWDRVEYQLGNIVENSKEDFRQFLIRQFGKEIFENKDRMAERVELARTYKVPVTQMMKTSETYLAIAKKITGREVPRIENARWEIVDRMSAMGLEN